MTLSLAEWSFWVATAIVVYTYIAYPLLISAIASFRRNSNERGSFSPSSVSIVICAFNEEAGIARRVDEVVSHVQTAGFPAEIIVVSDGSTDGTLAALGKFDPQVVRVIGLRENVGKAAALTVGCSDATGEIVVLADARQRWAADTLSRLLRPFSDPRVGGVGGELILESAPGVLAGVGMYWRFEKWLRRQESRIHSTVGVSGSISAVRRAVFKPIPQGTILDDVYWPLAVVMQGYRVVYAPGACAYDRLPAAARDEFRRKVRTLSGNFQLVMRLPAALLPWRNPIYFQYVSHKLARLIVPWALIAMLAVSAFLSGVGYKFIALLQAVAYLLAILGLVVPRLSRSRVCGSAASFLVLNAAAWVGFWVWMIGASERSWRKVDYVDISS